MSNMHICYQIVQQERKKLLCPCTIITLLLFLPSFNSRLLFVKSLTPIVTEWGNQWDLSEIVGDLYNLKKPIGPELLYLVGLEGSSHHGIVPMVTKLGYDRCRKEGKNCKPDNSLNCSFYPGPWAAAGLGTDVIYNNLLGDNRHTPHVRNVNGIRKEVEKAKRRGGLEFLSLQFESFPSGAHREPPWTIDLLHLHKALRSFLTVRYIVLLRSFRNTVYSQLTWDGGVLKHTELMSRHMIYLGSVLGKLPMPNWRILPVDCLYQDESSRALVISRLMDYLRWRPEGSENECLRYVLKDWHNSTKKSIPHADLKVILEVETRDEQKWGALRVSNYTFFKTQYLVNPTLCK